MARRRRGLARFISLAIWGLAIFGGWTLYHQNSEQISAWSDKASRLGERALKETKKLEGLKIPSGMVWKCWFNPTEKALKDCRAKNTCQGVGTWGEHPIRKEAYILGNSRCVKEYGECEFSYCERN